MTFRPTAAQKESGPLSGPLLSITYRCHSFGRTAPWDFCHPLWAPDSVGPVSDRRPVADPAVDLAGRAGSDSSWRFLSWERPDNGSQFGFVPKKRKNAARNATNYASLTDSDFLSSVTAPPTHRQLMPRVPGSSYEHTSTTRRTSRNPCFGATIGGAYH